MLKARLCTFTVSELVGKAQHIPVYCLCPSQHLVLDPSILVHLHIFHFAKRTAT